jgi:hypothetical protein
MFLEEGEYFIHRIKIWRVTPPDGIKEDGNINTNNKNSYEFLDRITPRQKTFDFEQYKKDKLIELQQKYGENIELDIMSKYKRTTEEHNKLVKDIGNYYVEELSIRGECTESQISEIYGVCNQTVKECIEEYFDYMGIGVPKSQ